jgi:hypothetical protein
LDKENKLTFGRKGFLLLSLIISEPSAYIKDIHKVEIIKVNEL